MYDTFNPLSLCGFPLPPSSVPLLNGRKNDDFPFNSVHMYTSFVSIAKLTKAPFLNDSSLVV